MEVIRKKNCSIVILDEKEIEKALYVEELIINSTTFSYRTSGNWITQPISRLVKIKEKLGGRNEIC